MFKITALILTLISAAPAFAAKVKEGGTVYVCASPDNLIKLTADLSDNKAERSAVVYVDGITKLYYEQKNHKQINEFLVAAVKNSTLQIRKNKRSPILVSLETTADTSHSQLAYSGEGVTVTKFDSSLSIPALKVVKQAVSCLETKWTD